MRTANAWKLGGGFSLIELLVVVAVIALLFAVLMPSLASAREQSREAVCATQLGQLCRAENEYQLTNREWIPGSPLTTGYYFAKNKDLLWGMRTKDKTKLRYNRFAATWEDYPTTLRSIMYKPSSIVAPNEMEDPAPVRARLIREAMENIFQCPSNQQVVPVWEEATGDFPPETWTAIRGVSYMTMWTLMRGGQNVIDSLSNTPSSYPGADPKKTTSEDHKKKPLTDPASCTDIGQYADWAIGVPRDYMPRHSRIGQESMKVYLADGFRFYDESTGELDYYPLFRGTKGLWMASPPSGAEYDKNIVVSREYNYAKSLSYRHGGKDRINAGFFDGHVESLGVSGHKVARDQLLTARFRGAAVHPKYYYPSGSIVNDPNALHLNTIAVGTRLP